MDILEEPKAHQSGEHGGSAVGDKGQGYPRHWHQPHSHPDIFKGLEGEPGDHPNADQSAEEVIGALGDQERSPEEEAKEEEHQPRSEKAGLLPCHGKDEVGLLFRDEAAVGLWSVEEAATQDSAGTNGYASLPKLIPALLGICSWIYE